MQIAEYSKLILLLFRLWNTIVQLQQNSQQIRDIHKYVLYYIITFIFVWHEHKRTSV